jgi:quercetin dioxygenase-like cupin family protein
MKHPFLIDINDPDNWLHAAKPTSPDGVLVESMHLLSMPEGERRLFAMTDSIMYDAKNAAGELIGVPPHEHWGGFETFFIEDGSMNFYLNGQKTLVGPGSLIHMQPYQFHTMTFNAPTTYRGFFHDWDNLDSALENKLLAEHGKDPRSDPQFTARNMGRSDMHLREPMDYTECPVEEVAAVRHPSRPLAEYRLDGITLKMLVGRWENAGACEYWRFELDKGFHAEWQEFPDLQEMYYVQEGRIKFTVFDEEFEAYPNCLVKIPKWAAHSIVALEKSVAVDVGGLTRWQALLQDYTSLKKFNPDRAEKPEELAALKERFGCWIQSFGVK